MTAGDETPIQPVRRPPGRLGIYAPWPLVGVTGLLVALVIFTPVIASNSHHPGPGILTQAELVVDLVPGNATFHFYIWALGEEIRYASMDVGVDTSFNWTGNTSVPWTTLNWTHAFWYNASDVLSEIVTSTANPVALTIYTHYVSPSGSTWYVGVIAFYVGASSPSSSESLYSASETSGVTVTSPLAVSNDTLPTTILLNNAGSGGGP